MNSKIVDRIAKMLRRAEDTGSTAAESDLCLGKAAALMAEHGVTRSMIDAANGASSGLPVRHEYFVLGTYAVDRCKALGHVAKALGVAPVLGIRRRVINFYATPAAGSEIMVLFSIIDQSIARKVKTVRPDNEWNSTKEFRGSWIRAFGTGLGEKLKEERASTVAATPGAGLVVRDETARNKAQQRIDFPRTGTIHSRQGSGAAAGFAAGKSYRATAPGIANRRQIGA